MRIEEIRKMLPTIVDAFQKRDAEIATESDYVERHGHPFTICTNCAAYTRHLFFPDAKIVGYHSDEFTGGHDFLLIDGKYIVDLWTRYIEGDKTAPILVDVENEPEVVKEWFGDPAKWEEVTEEIQIQW